jgi:hypothetical protein
LTRSGQADAHGRSHGLCRPGPRPGGRQTNSAHSSFAFLNSNKTAYNGCPTRTSYTSYCHAASIASIRKLIRISRSAGCAMQSLCQGSRTSKASRRIASQGGGFGEPLGQRLDRQANQTCCRFHWTLPGDASDWPERMHDSLLTGTGQDWTEAEGGSSTTSHKSEPATARPASSCRPLPAYAKRLIPALSNF